MNQKPYFAIESCVFRTGLLGMTLLLGLVPATRVSAQTGCFTPPGTLNPATIGRLQNITSVPGSATALTLSDASPYNIQNPVNHPQSFFINCTLQEQESFRFYTTGDIWVINDTGGIIQAEVPGDTGGDIGSGLEAHSTTGGSAAVVNFGEVSADSSGLVARSVGSSNQPAGAVVGHNGLGTVGPGAASVGTSGNLSHGMNLASIGGDGSAGISSSGGNYVVGGSGAAGAHAGQVFFNNQASIRTLDLSASGINAMSIGGNGGTGGAANARGAFSSISIGGSGGSGGNAEKITGFNSGTVTTSGINAIGVKALSIGGGGGEGGTANAQSIGIGGTFAMSTGGSGGAGGDGGKVDVTLEGKSIIETGARGFAGNVFGEHSPGVLAQSIGGGGGNGGHSVSTAISNPLDLVSVTVSKGGTGASGGNSDDVSVTTDSGSSITTNARASSGVVAQSIGGGGGNGGTAIDTDSGKSAVKLNVSVGMGGSAGNGGSPGSVIVGSNGNILTYQAKSNGIVAQSIAGGGGNGGNVIDSESETAPLSMNFDVTMGGTGGKAEAARNSAANIGAGGSVTTYGDHAAGIVVQSIGGGGGNGGSVQHYSSVTGGGFAGSVAGERIPTLVLNANVNLGGEGGAAGAAGNASSLLSGNIATHGVGSFGAHIQSIGGGGGNGGHVYSHSQTVTVTSQTKAISATVNVGGQASGGGAGGEAVANLAGGSIETHLARSSGLVVQSIGGSGGNGGVTSSVSLASSTPPTPSLMVTRFDNIDNGAPQDTSSLDITANVGGRGGAGGQGGSTDVKLNGGTIKTHGRQSHGVLAQSVGGGGGTGGHAMANGFVGINTYNFSLALGGSGGSGNSGGAVNLSRSQTAATTAVTTVDDHSFGVLAQSIGGGGGEGGSAHVDLAKAPAGLSKTAISLTIGGSGGTGGTGSTVAVKDLDISTSGIQSHGVVAQSIGGGGGSATVSSASGSTTLNLGGSGGDGGNGGSVSVSDITANTAGSLAAGIVAQSIGGGGGLAGIAGTNGLLNEAAASTVDSIFHLSRSGTGYSGADVLVGCTADAQTCQTTITTKGVAAAGIVAQSIGGGGSSSFLNLGSSGKASVAIGQPSGGDSGLVSLRLSGPSSAVSTSGNGAAGVVAQSMAGGGGALFTDASLAAVELNAGFQASGGNNGGIDVTLGNSVTTSGDFAPGAFVQAGHSFFTVFANDGQRTVREKVTADSIINLSFGNSLVLDSGGQISTSGKRSHGLFMETFSWYGATPDPAKGSRDRSMNIWVDGSINVTGDESWGVSAANEWDVSTRNNVPTPNVITSAFTLGSDAVINASNTAAGGIRITDTGNLRADVNGLINAGTGTAVDITAANTFLTIGDPNTTNFQNYYGDVKVSNTTPTGTNTITVSQDTILYGEVSSVAPPGGKSVIDIGGRIRMPGRTAIRVNEPDNNNSSITFSSIFGNIVAASGSSGPFTGPTVSLTNAGFINGKISGPFAYHMNAGSSHVLKIDAANNSGDSILAASFSSDAGASISATLTSLPTPEFSQIQIASITNGSGLASDLNFDNSGVTTYVLSAARNGDILDVTLSDIKINLNPAGLTGPVAQIAPLASKHVQAIRDGSLTPQPEGALYKTLLSAAIIEQRIGVDTLQSTLQALVGTSFDPDIQSSVGASRSASDSLHSCGGDQLASVNPIQQGECVWGSVTTTDVSLGNAGHDESSINFSMGQQRQLGERSYLGFGFGYDDVDITRDAGHGDGQRFHLGGVYKFINNDLFLSGSLVASYQRINSTRLFNDPFALGELVSAESDRNTVLLSSRLRGGYRFEFDRFDITPIMDLDAFLNHQFEYTERNAAGLGTHAASTSNLLFDAHPRIELGANFSLRDTSIRVYTQFGQRFALNDPSLNVGFGGGLAGSSTIEVEHDRENRLNSFGLGLIADLPKQLEFRLYYDLIDGDLERNERLGLKLAMKF